MTHEAEHRERRPYERTAMTESERAALQAVELRREYQRRYRQAKKAELAEYQRVYWQKQAKDLEIELGRCEAWEILEFLKTAQGEALAEAIRLALQRVENLPSSFDKAKGGRA